MTMVTMRLDLQPQCVQHHEPMVPCLLWQKFDEHVSPIHCYVCPHADCSYHWDIASGYFTTREGEHIQRDMKYWQKCMRHGLPMYLAEFNPQGSKRTWKCGQLGCMYARITEGPLTAAAAPS